VALRVIRKSNRKSGHKRKIKKKKEEEEEEEEEVFRSKRPKPCDAEAEKGLGDQSEDAL